MTALRRTISGRRTTPTSGCTGDPKQPLTVALLRVYAMERPQSLPALGEYGGCKSWVDLAEDVGLGDMTPALSDAEYEARATVIRQALDARAPAV